MIATYNASKDIYAIESLLMNLTVYCNLCLL